MKTPIVNTRVKTIVNPYDECYKTSAKTLPYKLRIDDCKLNTDDSFDVGSNNFLYIFRLEASIAAYYISFDYPKEVEDKYFFSNPKEGAGLLLSYYSSDLIDANDSYDMSQAKYLNLGIGKIQNSDWRLLNKWTVVPRLLFKGINDYVYLVISSRIKPILHVNRFPVNQPFFWDSPVATSLYSGQKLKDSSILLGVVKIITPYKHISSKEEKLNIRKYKEVVYSPHFSWKSPEKMLKVDTDKVCNVRPCKIVCNVGGRSYTNIVDVYVYHSCRNKKGNDITAFVWRSGSEDDLVKKAYICKDYKEGDSSVYNEHSYLLESLSLGAIYHSFASLTKISEESVARYVVRQLARQPQGHRSISIDGKSLQYLFGGVLYYIECLLNDKDAVENGDLYERIKALYEANSNSHLRYEAKVNYNKVTNGQDKYFLQNILDIEDGSSGCGRIASLLSNIFSFVSKMGINIDYIYCDIENIYGKARDLLVHRFSTEFQDEFEGNFFNGILFDEIKKDREFSKSLESLGYCFGKNGNALGEISSVLAGDDKAHLYYGIANERSYARRRNMNVWDVVMNNYTNELFYKYIFNPILNSLEHPLKRLPQIPKCSADSRYHSKGYLNRAERYETYLGGSLELPGGMYSSIPLYGDHMTRGYIKPNMDNWKILPEPTLFSFFMDHINRLRVTAFSSPQNHFNVFIPSWNLWAFDINKIREFRVYNDKGEIIKHDVTEEGKAIAYHRELLYHTFLMNPDKAIAYFSLDSTVEDKAHYINLEAEKEDGYFKFAYDELNQILENINNRLGTSTVVPLTKTLAVETEPYVLSCAEVNNKWIWRLTVDELSNRDNIKKENGYICFVTKGRKITFSQVENNPLEDDDTNKVGFWIVTPKGVAPKIEFANSEELYYFKYPPYLEKLDTNGTIPHVNGILELSSSKTILKLNDFRAYTLFGELPQKLNISIKFIPKGNVCENNWLLWSGDFVHNEDFLRERQKYINEENNPELIKSNQRLFHVEIGGSQKENNVIPFGIYGDGCEKFNDSLPTEWGLQKETLYTLCLQIEFEKKDGEYTGNGNASYRLCEGDTQEVVAGAKSTIYSNNIIKTQYFISSLSLCYFRNIQVWEGFDIKDFRLYFSGHQEKVELFRESNGLNISRVNKGVPAYADFDAAETFDDTIFAKVSWLNAEKRSIKYVLNISVGKISGGNIYPIDGRIINHYVDENDDLHFEVAPESEGYILVNLPNVSIKKGGKIRYELLADEQQVIQENIPLSNILKPKTI